MTGKVERNWLDQGKRLLSYFPVLLIIDPRQCGKTVLSKQLRPEWEYFDLENSSDYDLITGDLPFFFREHNEHIIIDEAQLSSELFKELRGIIDQDRDRKNRFILTGSSSPELLNNISESLAGRAALIELGTLSMNERLQIPISPFFSVFNREIDSKTIERLGELSVRIPHEKVMESLLHGGYPEPVLSADKDFQNYWMEQYYNSYIQRDIRSLFPKLELVKYRRFLGMLSGLNFWLARVNSQEKLMHHPGVGACFESFITEELIKGLSITNSSRKEYFYYRTKNGAEVDFIVHGDFGILPIEIKFGVRVKGGSLRWLNDFLDKNSLPLGIVINNSDCLLKLSEKIIQIPAGVL